MHVLSVPHPPKFTRNQELVSQFELPIYVYHDMRQSRTGEYYKQVNFDRKLVDLRGSILAMVVLLLWPRKRNFSEPGPEKDLPSAA
jgi:hypothetical protein